MIHPVLFHKWVPYWGRFIAVITLMITTLVLNGTYTGSTIDISGALSVLREDISMAYYATTAGMIAAYPMAAKVRSLLSTKTILLSDLILQCLLSSICLHAESIYTIISCSFLIGFLKAFMMLEVIVLLRPFLSPKNIRSQFYSYFYPMVYTFSQLSLLITSIVAYNFQWQYMYYVAIILLLISILIVISLLRFEKKRVKISVKGKYWRSMLFINFILLMTVYTALYGKVLDWTSSPIILTLLIAIPVLSVLYLSYEKNTSNPYIDLHVFGYLKTAISYAFIAVAMFIISSNTLINSYATSIIGVNNVKSNALNLFTIPGFILGGFICYWWFKLQIYRFRTLIFWGMFFLSLYLGMLYFGISPEGTYEYLFLPMFFRGMGMIIIFIAFGVYAVEDLPIKYTIQNAFFIVCIRSCLAPVLASSFFSNLLYRLQNKYILHLGESVGFQSPQAAEIYEQKIQNALMQGYSFEDATVLATSKLYSAVNTQASLQAMKEIFGYMLIVSLVIMVISRFTHFYHTLKIKQVKAGDDMI